MRSILEQKLRSPELVHLGGLQTEHRNQGQKQYIDRVEPRFSTPEILRLEQKMLVNVERIVRGRNSESSERFVDEAISARERTGSKLDPEQADAVRYLTSGPGVRLLSGVAGTGKTFTLSTAHEIWKREGRNVIGCAVAGATAKRLQAGTGIQATTLESTLWALDHDRLTLTPKSVVLVDESGMVGTKHLARLLEHVKDSNGARLILVGDAKQLQPISAGGPFKYLASVLGEARLENIRRQNEVWDREAVKDFERGNSADALKAYVDHGRFHLTEGRPEAMGKLIKQWRSDGGIQDPSRVFLLASLNTKVKELNLRA